MLPLKLHNKIGHLDLTILDYILLPFNILEKGVPSFPTCTDYSEKGVPSFPTCTDYSAVIKGFGCCIPT
jgi:hypothetical protein